MQKTNASTILIVDDTPGNLGIAVSLLEGRGYSVAIAQDGEEGLQRAQILQPDLILLDAMMPGVDGFEICRRLKALEATRDIPVIFMTALASPEHKVKGFTAGAIDYITKPLQIEEVIARVETHIKLHTALRQLEIQNAQLQAREQEYRTLIDALPDMVVRFDTELRRTYVNSAWEKTSGLSAEDVINVPATGILHQPSSNQYIAKLQKVLETGTVQNIEFDWVNARRETISLEYTIVPEFDQYGKVIGVLSVGHDITERKRTEDALYFIAQRGWLDGTESFFDALAQYLGEALEVDYVGIDRLDKTPGVAETAALYAKGAIVPNRRYDLKGTPCGNVIGQKFCFYPQGIQRLFPDDALLAEIGAESYAGIPLWDSAGKPIGLISVMDGKPLHDGGSISRLLQLVAIRAGAELERERSDRLLREREQEFRSLANNLPDNIARWDRAGRYLYINPAHELTLKTTSEQALGKLGSEIYPDGRFNNSWQVVVRAVETGQVQLAKVPVPQADGSVRIHEVSYVPERNTRGEIVSVLGIGRDITERMHLEDESRRHAQFQQSLLSGMLDAGVILVVIENGHFVYTNDHYVGCQLGYTKGQLPETVSFINLIYPDDRPRIAEMYRDRLAGKPVPTSYEIGVLAGDGSRLEYEFHVTVVPDTDPPQTLLLALDIGGRKRTEMELQRREREFRTLAENMPDSLIRYDRDGHRTYINPALKRISAVREEQMIGLTQQESNPFIMPEMYRLALEHTLATGERSELELQIPTPSGDIRTNLISIAAERTEDGQISGAITIGHDITERKQAEALLVRREREFRTLAENMPDNLVRYNREGVTVYVNPVLERTLGDTAAALIGKTPREYYPDGSYEDYAVLLDSVLAGGEAGVLEKRFPAPDGETRVHLIRMVPERCENGEIVGVLTIGHDITERKQAEQQLRDLSAHLHTVREEEKIHLAREIHDDLGSTLAAIKLKISLLLDFELPQEMKDTPLHTRLESILPMLDSAVTSMRRIVTGMRPEVLDSLGLLAALKWQAEQFRKSSGIECLIVCANDHGCVDCKGCEFQPDKILSINLFRIFQEALTNVARHSGASRVEVQYRPGNGEILLSIADNGCGMPDGYTPASGSFGIRGMRERVWQLGGQISFDNPPDGGFCVTVRFPFATGI